MKRTTYSIAAICDKAGRSVNQDNFWICPDLSAFLQSGQTTFVDSKTEIELSEKGALFVVADGMGGMSAGEIASQLVIDSIKQSFTTLDTQLLDNHKAIQQFISQSIIDADAKIKEHAKSNPDTAGMGSTIVLLWIFQDNVFVGWCGDSRAYCYNPKNSLVRLTHDHSYVQELVDANKLPEALAFDHPHSNIITRSLGDSGEAPLPEVMQYPLHNGDTFLLCSDGLCGLLRDGEIEEILSNNTDSVSDSLKSLWQEGQTIGWTDNATIEIVKILNGGIAPSPQAKGYALKQEAIEQQSTPAPDSKKSHKKHKALILISVLALIIGFLFGGVLVHYIIPFTNSSPKSIVNDSSQVVTPIDTLSMEKTIMEETTDSMPKKSTPITKPKAKSPSKDPVVAQPIQPTPPKDTLDSLTPTTNMRNLLTPIIDTTVAQE